MDQDANPVASPLTPSESKKWIVRIVLALVLGQAIWGLVVSLTSGLLVPLTARVMGNDPSSPLYLGKGDIDIPAVFVSVVEFCLAGIVAVVLNSWVQKPPKTVRRKAVASPGSLSLKAAPVVPIPLVAAPKPPLATAPPVPAQPVAAPPAKTVQSAAAPAPVVPAVAATAAKPAPPAAPPKPAKPKEVYYNIVGDPITMDDD